MERLQRLDSIGLDPDPKRGTHSITWDYSLNTNCRLAPVGCWEPRSGGRFGST